MSLHMEMSRLLKMNDNKAFVKILLEQFIKFSFIIFASYLLALVNTFHKTLEIEEMPNKEESAFPLILFFVIGSLILFIILKYLKIFMILNLLELFVLFFSSYVISFVLLNNEVFALIFSLLMLALRIFKILTTNITASINSIGASFIIGASIPLLPLLIFSLFLIVYDIFSVFISKHMIELAVIAKKQDTAMLIESKREIEKPGKPGKKELQAIVIGTGDIILPASLIIASIPLGIDLFMFFSSLIGYWLMITALLILKRPLPALPFVLLPQLLVLFIFTIF